MIPAYPYLIAPLFNKFTPLPEDSPVFPRVKDLSAKVRASSEVCHDETRLIACGLTSSTFPLDVCGSWTAASDRRTRMPSSSASLTSLSTVRPIVAYTQSLDLTFFGSQSSSTTRCWTSHRQRRSRRFSVRLLTRATLHVLSRRTNSVFCSS